MGAITTLASQLGSNIISNELGRMSGYDDYQDQRQMKMYQLVYF